MSNAFHAAIEATPGVVGRWQAGKQALGSDKRFVTLADNSKCDGSIFIEKALEKHPLHKGANFWDYALMYDGRVVYIEVHSASSGDNIRKMIAKARWLQSWLTNHAIPIKKLPTRFPFVWIAPGSVDTRPSSAQSRALADAGLKAISHLTLS